MVSKSRSDRTPAHGDQPPKPSVKGPLPGPASGTARAPLRLESKRLAVDIAHPGTVYTGSRFDWTAFIVQVTLDGKHTFCVPESQIPGQGTGGIGLCNEFGLTIPIGYDDAAPGDLFPKIGVGLLERPDEKAYACSRPYRVEPAPVTMEEVPHGYRFSQTTGPCRGYHAHLTKVITISDEAVEVAYDLRNLGRHQLRSNEYNHNFVAIDGHPPDVGYRLRLPEGLAPRMACSAHQKGRDYIWASPISKSCYWAMDTDPVHADTWELVHMPSGVGMRETTTPGWSRLGLYCAYDLISPEAFVAFNLAPGEAASWRRRWEFFTVAS